MDPAGSCEVHLRCRFLLREGGPPVSGRPMPELDQPLAAGALDPRPDTTPPTIQYTSPNPANLFAAEFAVGQNNIVLICNVLLSASLIGSFS